MRVCDNPECQYHFEMPTGVDPHSRYVRVYPRQKLTYVDTDHREIRIPDIVEVQRHRYARRSLDEVVYLCTCCHTAVQMFGR